MWEWILALPVTLLIWSISEYCIHRWVQHGEPVGRWKAASSRSRFVVNTFDRHAIKHHKQGRNDVNVDIVITDTLPAVIPIAIPLWFVSPVITIAFVLFSAPYCYLWTKMHRAFHGIETNWTVETPFYDSYKSHHELHHQHPTFNFGTVFPWTDYLFGTKMTCPPKRYSRQSMTPA